jgi:glycosyltransferase involved in cell wall biosynthesis
MPSPLPAKKANLRKVSRARSRVLITAAAARSGGGAARVREVVNSMPLLAPGHQYLLTLNQGQEVDLDLPPQVTSIPVPQLFADPLPLAIWSWFRLPARVQPGSVDWVLAPFGVAPLTNWPLPSPCLAVILSNIGPFAPQIYRPTHGYQAARLRLLRSLTLASLRAADRIFLLSQEAYRYVGIGVDDAKVTFLPMAPPSPAVLAEAQETRLLPALAGRPFFVTVGDLLLHKGIEDAIHAIDLVARRYPDVRLVVCGYPMDRAYANRLSTVAQAASPGGVLFTGALPHAQALALMRESVATVICSRIENPNRVPSEAMSVGSPLVAADVPVSREVCGDAALYYPVRDHSVLAEHMTQLIEGTGEPSRDALIAAGERRIAGLDWLSATRTILHEMDLF